MQLLLFVNMRNDKRTGKFPFSFFCEKFTMTNSSNCRTKQQLISYTTHRILQVWRDSIGIVDTEKWLRDDFDKPIKICARLQKQFDETNPRAIYEYLLRFGMYKPNRRNRESYKKLADANFYKQVEDYYQKLKKRWQGPDIPIYIFPLDCGSHYFRKEGKNKSGVSFKDKMFLFLSPQLDERELEALMVHEYHHVCRINIQRKKVIDYSLLDSMILEGLAESAVEKICGPEWQADWCSYYSEDELSFYWKEHLSEDLTVTKRDPLHDKLLYGSRGVPALLGYAAGYHIIKQFKRTQKLTEKASFRYPSEKFTIDLEL